MPRLTIALLLSALAATATAAEWDLVKKITAQPVGTSRGLAFAAGDLLYTVREKSLIYRLSTADGSIKSSFPTPRVVGALAYDAVQQRILAATYDGAAPVLYEFDLAGTKLSELPLTVDADDVAVGEIDGLELSGNEIYYSTDIGTRLYVADRTTLTVLRRMAIGKAGLSGHAIGGYCLYSGDVGGNAYRLIRSQLDGLILSTANTQTIGSGGSPYDFPPEDLAFDATTFAVPVLWVAVPYIPNIANPIWAIETVDCSNLCPNPPPPASVGNTLRGAKLLPDTAVYSWQTPPGLASNAYAEGLKQDIPAHKAVPAVVSTPAWSLGLGAAPLPAAFLDAREVNCAGIEGP